MENGADIEAQEVAEGYTALILASAHGYLDIVTCLLDQGARRDVITRDGDTALTWAIERSRPGSDHNDIVNLLSSQ